MAHPEIIQRRRSALTLTALVLGGLALMAGLWLFAEPPTHGGPGPMQRLLDERAAAVAGARRETDPLNWAIAQALHGEALKVSAEMHGRSPEIAGEAIGAYRAALQVLSYEQRPHLWSLSQLNLGDALVMYGDGLADAMALAAAVAAYDAAERGFLDLGNDVLAEAARSGRDGARRAQNRLSGG